MGPLRFFSSENKSYGKICVDLDTGLKFYVSAIFGHEMAKILIFFLRSPTKLNNFSEMRHPIQKERSNASINLSIINQAFFKRSLLRDF